MRTTIDDAGRLVIPKALRDRAGLATSQEVEVTERDGVIEIEPAATPMRLVRRRRGVAAVAEAEVPSLTDDLVRETIERTRR